MKRQKKHILIITAVIMLSLLCVLTGCNHGTSDKADAGKKTNTAHTETTKETTSINTEATEETVFYPNVSCDILDGVSVMWISYADNRDFYIFQKENQELQNEKEVYYGRIGSVDGPLVRVSFENVGSFRLYDGLIRVSKISPEKDLKKNTIFTGGYTTAGHLMYITMEEVNNNVFKTGYKEGEIICLTDISYG